MNAKKREVDLTTGRGHSDRGRGDRIYRLQERLEKVAKRPADWTQLIGVMRGLLDFLADEYDTENGS